MPMLPCITEMKEEGKDDGFASQLTTSEHHEAKQKSKPAAQMPAVPKFRIIKVNQSHPNPSYVCNCCHFLPFIPVFSLQ